MGFRASVSISSNFLLVHARKRMADASSEFHVDGPATAKLRGP